MYNHNLSIQQRVKDLLNLADENFAEYSEVHRLASIEMISIIGQANYGVYSSIFSVLTDEEYQAILAKQIWEQSAEERVLMICESSEAYLYAYYLLTKVRKISNNNVINNRIATSGNSLEIGDQDDVHSMAQGFYNKAKSLLDSVDFTLGNGGINQRSGFFIFATPNGDDIDDSVEE